CRGSGGDEGAADLRVPQDHRRLPRGVELPDRRRDRSARDAAGRDQGPRDGGDQASPPPVQEERRGAGLAVDDPVVITCSISVALANRDECPAIPYTPEEYSAEARRIVDEGGTMIHIHARRPDGTPSYEVEDFRAISDAIRAECGDGVIVNFSTGAM